MIINPNSRWCRFRNWLADRIDPRPLPGTAWCIDCAMNAGRTLVIKADEAISHAGAHEYDHSLVRIVTVWSARRPAPKAPVS